MAYPSVSDDGTNVSLDLHGATVHEAERLALNAAAVAYKFGRRTLRIVHGSSTSQDHRTRITIRDRLRTMAGEHAFGSFVTSTWAQEDVLVLGLAFDSPGRPARISILDIEQ